ncbi:MAG TPA: hypothetical protein VN902_00945 [Candidatus Acidoferrales bacterium]|nr:hypothetical protein [Candidatus Acidoferrales bacterium]
MKQKTDVPQGLAKNSRAHRSPSSETWMVVRSTASRSTRLGASNDAQQLAPAIRNTLRDLDPALPLYIQSWIKEMDRPLFASRMAALSLGVLGLIGALLSVTGIFGMAAYSVSKRLRELGIRIALGAQRKEVLQAAWVAHSSCSPSVPPQACYWEFWPAECLLPSYIKQLRAIP